MNDAYVAGLIDGEGCISIAQHGGGKWCSARVDVGMSRKSLVILESLQRSYGGRIRSSRVASEKWEAASAWGVYGIQAAVFLRRIAPHLILKAEQARLAICLQDMIDSLPKRANGNGIWDLKARHRAQIIRKRVQELNRKGPMSQAENGDGWFARLVAGVWVTPQVDMFTDLGLESYSKTWPRAGMTRNGRAYRLPPLALPTKEIGSSSWLTPTANLGVKGNRLTRGLATRSHSLGSLQEQLARWYWKDRPEDDPIPGPVTPEWLEWLMGLPIGWTELPASETPSSPKLLSTSDGAS